MGGRRLLPASLLCGGGGRVATRMRRRNQRERATRPPPPPPHPVLAPPSTASKQQQQEEVPYSAAGGDDNNNNSNSNSKTAVTNKSPPPAGRRGGGCYVNGDGALMVEVAAAGGSHGNGGKDGGGRRVMVVVDGRNREAAGVLEWALSQAVRCNDTVVLLSVVKPVAPQEAVSDSCVKMLGPKCSKHIEAMKRICESTRPEVKVETCVVEGEDRAPAVVEAARRHGASLLVLGQRRRLRVARWLQALWRRRWRRTGMVEYCIEHAPCVALAVRRRSSGGYLVSSKSHKDFWLLA